MHQGPEHKPLVARVIAEHKTQCILAVGESDFPAVMRGKFYADDYGGDFPKVGDYVEYVLNPGSPAVIEAVVPRRTQIVRKAAGEEKPQIIVTNVDVMFIVMGLDNDFNMRRLERYLMLARQSNITPVIVLNKSDTVEDIV